MSNGKPCAVIDTLAEWARTDLSVKACADAGISAQIFATATIASSIIPPMDRAQGHAGTLGMERVLIVWGEIIMTILQSRQ